MGERRRATGPGQADLGVCVDDNGHEWKHYDHRTEVGYAEWHVLCERCGILATVTIHDDGISEIQTNRAIDDPCDLLLRIARVLGVTVDAHFHWEHIHGAAEEVVDERDNLREQLADKPIPC